jgi:hypothetical protein
MKKLLTAAFAALAIASPAQAGQYMPNLYASKFCEALTAGVAWSEAVSYANAWAYVKSLPDAPVGSDGKPIDRSFLVQASSRRCPEAMEAAYRVHLQAQARKEAEARKAKALNANPMHREFVSVWGAAPVEGVTPVWGVSQ